MSKTEAKPLPWTLNPRAFGIRMLMLGATMGAVWYLGLKPWSESIGHDRSELESMQSALNSQADTILSADQIAELNSRVLTASRQLTVWSQKASESSGLYDRIRRIAEAQQVKIGRIEPKSSGIVPPLPGEKPPENAVIPDIQTTGYAVQVTGSFDNIARFLDALEAGLGSSKVASIRLVPIVTGNRQSVEATIETIHYRIATKLDERITSASLESKEGNTP